MRVTLISPYQSVSSLGIRSLSAYLRRAGHQTTVIFLPLPDNTGWYDAYESESYSPRVVEDVARLSSQSQLIGMTLMTQHFLPMANLSRSLKGLGVPIAWGGIHPTARPDEALEYADMVCLGEGEEALLEVVQRMAAGQDYSDVRNFWFKRDGGIVRNPPRPVIADLDSLPFYDYDASDHYVLDDDALRPMTEELLKKYLALDIGFVKDTLEYRTMVTRGCPHNCNYCCNNVLWKLYDNRSHLRQRSAEHVIRELAAVKQRLPFVGSVSFVDDTLFALSDARLQNLAQMYKEQIGLPFSAFCSPSTISEQKLGYLVEAGLVRVSMGIQSGSDRVLDSYQRHVSKDQVLNAARIIHKFSDRLQPPRYDIITDNPWETDEDRIATLALLQELPRPFRVLSHSLTFFPGTQLHERARAEGLISDEREQVLKKNFWVTGATYYNLLHYCYTLGFPRWVMAVLTHRRVYRLLSSPWLLPLYRQVAKLRDWLRRSLSVQKSRRLRTVTAGR